MAYAGGRLLVLSNYIAKGVRPTKTENMLDHKTISAEQETFYGTTRWGAASILVRNSIGPKGSIVIGFAKRKEWGLVDRGRK